MASNDVISVISNGNKANDPERAAYKKLACAIINSAIKEHDVQFFKREWCYKLCVLANIDYDALCEKVGVK